MTEVLLTLVLLLGWHGGIAPADVSGTWQVTMDGEKKPIEGTLVLQQTGADVTGRWKAIDEWTMTGRADAAGRFTVESDRRPIPMTIDSKKGTIAARWVFRGALKDGALSGTASLEIENTEPRTRKWSAVKSRE